MDSSGCYILKRYQFNYFQGLDLPNLPAKNRLTRYPLGVYTQIMIVDIKKRAVHRSKIIEGQIRALQKAINSEAYCMDILTQSLAIQKSLASLNKLILENHLKTHVTDMLQADDPTSHQKAIGELLNLYELNNIRTKS